MTVLRDLGEDEILTRLYNLSLKKGTLLGGAFSCNPLTEQQHKPSHVPGDNPEGAHGLKRV